MLVNSRLVVKLFKLPSGMDCHLVDDCFRVADTKLTVPDVVELTRACLTELPLRVRDERLKLVNEIRESLIKEEPRTGRRWVVLDALRQVSMRKWRSRQWQAA